jgi:hypothetical protein
MAYVKVTRAFINILNKKNTLFFLKLVDIYKSLVYDSRAWFLSSAGRAIDS